jgi:hypothetical protein
MRLRWANAAAALFPNAIWRIEVRTLSKVLLAVALAFGASAITAAPAAAEDVTPMALLCDNLGETWYTMTNVSKPKELTHGERYYNGSGSNVTTSFVAKHHSTITASISVTAGVKAEAGTIFAKLEASASVTVAGEYASTSGTDVGITATLPHDKYLVAYRGYLTVSANWGKYYCTTSGTMQTKGEGAVKSWNEVPETGVQRCDLSAPSGSMASVAKARLCDGTW